MDIKFKKIEKPFVPQASQQSPNRPTSQIKQIINNIKIPFAPIGIPGGIPTPNLMSMVKIQTQLPPLLLPGANLSRAVDYLADYGGCGFWRMIWPAEHLNGYQKAVINSLTTMVLDPRFYQGIKAVRLQRQATPQQLEFVKFLRHLSNEYKFKLIYEIDDIIFKNDIPDFNRCKVAFEDDGVVQSILEMMKLCDEISVTCEYMKEYYRDKTLNKNITVIPNYPPKSWADNFYDEKKLNRNYNQNKKKPRVGYCGSGTHIDVINKTNQNDDFTHIVNAIMKTRKEFHWVLMGCYPLPLKPFIDSGEIEYADWAPIYDYPSAIDKLNLNATFAPLIDCPFNKAKSEIKFLEAACQGIPGVYQDLITYKNAPLKFKTGDDLINQLKFLFKDEQTYMKISKQSRKYAETMFLNSHLDEYAELYFTPYGDDSRKALLKHNPEQKRK